MRLAPALTANENDIVGTVDELAAMKLADHRLVDFASGEVEPSQVLVGGVPSFLDPVGCPSSEHLAQLAAQISGVRASSGG